MEKNFRISFLLIIATLSFHRSVAQFTFLDSTFGVNGSVLSDFYGTDRCRNAAVQSDGKIILVGYADSNSPFTTNFLTARYTEDGLPDSTFSSDGFDSTGISDYLDMAETVGVQQDGKIIVAGLVVSTNNAQAFGALRYNSDGTPDTTFGQGGKTSTPFGNLGVNCRGLAFTPAGKIIIGGYATGNSLDLALVRYDANGSHDSTFGNGGVILVPMNEKQMVLSIAVQPDDKVLVSGFHSLSSVLGGYPGSFLLARFNPDGTADSTFNGNGLVLDSVSGHSANSMILLNDGKIIAGGNVYYQGTDNFALAKYNSDGSPDSTFGINGRVMTILGNDLSRVESIALQPDGKILVAGYAAMYYQHFTLLRYHSNGGIDSSFGTNGVVANNIGTVSAAYDVLVQPSGKIIVSGTSGTTTSDFGMARYAPNFSASIPAVKKSDVVVAPNPLTEMSRIIFENPGSSPVTFFLYDMTGRLVEKAVTNGNEFAVSRTGKQPGMYYFNLRNEKSFETVKGKIMMH
jgi:uncharacterized delta-60 repeat protein